MSDAHDRLADEREADADRLAAESGRVGDSIEDAKAKLHRLDDEAMIPTPIEDAVGDEEDAQSVEGPEDPEGEPPADPEADPERA